MVVLAALCLWAIWLSLGFVAFGDRSFVRVNDCGDSNLAMAIAAQTEPGKSLIGGRNATAVCGFNQIATWGWTPFDWLFRFLPGWLAYGTMMFSQRLIAALGAAWLARRALGAGPIAMAVAGCGYSLFCQFSINDSWSGFTFYDTLSLPALPLILLALMESVTRAASGRLGSSCALALLTGGLYGVFGGYVFQLFTITLAFIWLAWLFRNAPFRQWVIPFACFGIAWLIAVLPAASAGVALGGDSHRAGTLESHTPADAIAGAWRLLVLSWKDNWPFALALAAGLILPPWRHRTHARLAVVTTACITAVLLAKATSILLRDYLGFLQGFQFQRFYLLLPFLACFGAASAVHKLIASQKRWTILTGWACGIMLLGWTAHRSWGVQQLILKTVVDGWSWSLYTDPDLRNLRERTQNDPPFRVVTVANHGTSLWHPNMMATYGFESADGYVPLYPARYHDFWGAVIAPHREADPKLDAYFSNWGNRAYVFGPLAGWPADGSPTPFEQLANLNLLSLANVRYIISPAPLSHPNLTTLLERPASVPPKGFRRKFSSRLKAMREGYTPRPPLYIYENAGYLPRVYLADSVTVLDNPEEVLKAMADWEPKAGSERPAFVERSEHIDFPPSQTPAPKPPSITSPTTELFEIKSTVDQPTVLVTNLSKDAAWHLKIGDQTAQHHLISLNRSFIGITLPRGSLTLRLIYLGHRTVD